MMRSLVVLAAILLCCLLSSAAFLVPCSAASSPLYRTRTRLHASPYNDPPPAGPGRRRRASKWIDAELMKQKELEKRQGKQQAAASGSGPDLFPSPPGSSSSNKEKDKKFLSQARQQLQAEVDTLIERLTGIYQQVKDQSNKITTFGVADFNPKVATLTDQIGTELESLLGRLEGLKAALGDGEGEAGGAATGGTGKGTPDFLVTQSFALKALSKDLEGLLFLIEAREREVDILLRSLGMEEGGEDD